MNTEKSSHLYSSYVSWFLSSALQRAYSGFSSTEWCLRVHKNKRDTWKQCFQHNFNLGVAVADWVSVPTVPTTLSEYALPCENVEQWITTQFIYSNSATNERFSSKIRKSKRGSRCFIHSRLPQINECVGRPWENLIISRSFMSMLTHSTINFCCHSTQRLRTAPVRCSPPAFFAR